MPSRKQPTRSAPSSARQPRAPSPARERARSAELTAKSQRLSAKERPTFRREGWTKASARARKLLADAERETDPAKVKELNDKAQKLLAEAERLRKLPPPSMVDRAGKLVRWRADTNKPVPSTRLVRLFQQQGQWCAQADGTFNGELTWTVPFKDIETAEGWLPPRTEPEAFAQWFVSKTDGLEWLNKEPVFLAAGLQLGKMQEYERDFSTRYDKIRGRTSAMLWWRSPLHVQEQKQQGKKRPKIKNPWSSLVLGIMEAARNIMGADIRVGAVSLFAHYGPTRPIGEVEFKCDEPTKAPPTPYKGGREPKRIPGRKVPAKVAPRYGFVVYDEKARRYLNVKTYSYQPGMWGALRVAHIFESRAKAQSAASNLNARRPKGRKYHAVVWPVELPP